MRVRPCTPYRCLPRCMDIGWSAGWKVSSIANSPRFAEKCMSSQGNAGSGRSTTSALAELRSSRFGDDAPVVKPAVEYALWVSSDTPDLAKRLLNHPNQLVARSALSRFGRAS